MRICRFADDDATPQLGAIRDDGVHPIAGSTLAGLLAELEAAPEAVVRRLEGATRGTPACGWTALQEGSATGYRLLAPLDEQEVWAAGVTYQRSAQAREEESKQSGIYDRVYHAERPESGLRWAGEAGRVDERDPVVLHPAAVIAL